MSGTTSDTGDALPSTHPSPPTPPPPPSSLDIGIPGIVDAYEIGRGGFAVVYRGHRQGFDQSVAVKVLAASLDAQGRQRFDREVRAMGALFGHPHIVGIISAGYTVGDRPYLVMEDMTGGSLADALRIRGRYAWQEATEIGIALASALEAAHSAHVLHCDVKPENVLYSRYGAPKLGDFGLAALAEGPETRSTAVMVSVAHAAPEVLDGAPRTPGTDIYALASTIMTLILGRPPFAREANETPAAIFKRISMDPVQDLRSSGVPDSVCRVLERAMAKTPSARYSTAAAFRIDLERARDGALGKPPGVAPADQDMTELWTPEPPVGPPAPTGALAAGRPPLVGSTTPPRKPAGGSESRGSVPPVHSRVPVLPPIALAAIGGAVVIVVVLFIIFVLIKPPGPGPKPVQVATVSAARVALAANPDLLAEALVKTPFSARDLPSAWSTLTHELLSFSKTGMVADIEDALSGPADVLDVNYGVFTNQGESNSSYTETNLLYTGETQVGQFSISGIADPIRCLFGDMPKTSAASALWIYSCTARSGEVETWLNVKLGARADATAKSLMTTLASAAMRNLASVAATVPARAPGAPPGALQSTALFDQLASSPFDAALVPTGAKLPSVSISSFGANPPTGLLGPSDRIVVTMQGPYAGQFIDYFVFDTAANAQTSFAAGIPGTAFLATGFTQPSECANNPEKDNAGNTIGFSSSCFVVSGNVVVGAFTETSGQPTSDSEVFDQTLTRAGLMYVTDVAGA